MRLVFIFLFLCPQLFANRYLEVLEVHEGDEQTFTTTREYAIEVFEGMPGLLSTDNFSAKVRVVSYDRNSIEWELASKDIVTPFFQGEQLLFQNYENLLTRQQRFYSKKNIKKIIKEKETLKKEIKEKKLSGYNIDIHFGSQVSSTYTLISSDDLEQMTDFGLNFAYFLPISKGVHFAPGIGFSTGALKTTTDSNTINVTEITAEFVFQLTGTKESDNIPYFGIGMGVGLSSTEFATVKTEGHTISIPRLTAGILMPVKGTSKGISTEIIVDGVSIRESKDGTDNNANLVRIKFAVGYQSFF